MRYFIRSFWAKVFTAAMFVGMGSQLAYADRVGGLGMTEERVEARDTDTYVQKFYGGEEAAIVVKGDGDTDLDVYVYDDEGNCVAGDDDEGDLCIVRFYPRRTQKYRIVVQNLGTVYNRYQIGVR